MNKAQRSTLGWTLIFSAIMLHFCFIVPEWRMDYMPAGLFGWNSEQADFLLFKVWRSSETVDEGNGVKKYTKTSENIPFSLAMGLAVPILLWGAARVVWKASDIPANKKRSRPRQASYEPAEGANDPLDSIVVEHYTQIPPVVVDHRTNFPPVD